MTPPPTAGRSRGFFVAPLPMLTSDNRALVKTFYRDGALGQMLPGIRVPGALASKPMQETAAR